MSDGQTPPGVIEGSENPMTDMRMPQAPVTLLDIYTRQVEMNSQLAVIHEQLRAIPDHESRLRALETAMPDNATVRMSALEQFRWKTSALASLAGVLSGGGTASVIIWALSRH